MQTWNEVSNQCPDELIRIFFLPSAGKIFIDEENFFGIINRKIIREEFFNGS